MNPGSSKYEPLAVRLVQSLPAEAIALVVVDGPLGHGAGLALVQNERTPQRMREIARLLRLLADSVEQDSHTISRTPGQS